MIHTCPWTISGAARLNAGGALFTAVKKISHPETDLHDLQKFLLDLPDFPVVDFDNFRRGDAKVKSYLLAASAAVFDAGVSCGENAAVLDVSRDGSHLQNLEYFRDYLNFGRTSGRGHLFVGTLSSTPLCEAAISLGFHGPAYYLDTLGRSAPVRQELSLLLADPAIPFVLLFHFNTKRLLAFLVTRGQITLSEEDTPDDLFFRTGGAR